MNPVHHFQSSLLFGAIVLLACFFGILALPAFALDGQVGIHDPSTVILCDGKYYTYGTGGTPLVSDDGWTWRAGVRAARSGAAPDVIHIGDRYYMYISGVTMIWSKTLDPNSPDYKWENVDGGRIAGADSDVDVNPIDPAAFLDPTDGSLWLTFGSYVGYLQLVQLDPKTGLRLHPEQKPLNVGINLEASCMIYHDGWYYLLGTHGSCCAGSSSGYHIRVGRSKKVTGPFIDNVGMDMIKGGGKLFCGSGGRVIGPGHFGLIDCGDGVQKFSLHWEADLDKGGISVVDILPVLWKDGWPVAGENVKEGTYEIESARTGNALELAVEGVPVGGGRGGRGGGMGMSGRGAGMGAGGRGDAAGAVAPGAPAATGAPGVPVAPAAAGGPGAAPAAGNPGAPATAGAPGAPAGEGGRGAGMGRGGFGGMGGGRGGAPVPNQDVAQVSVNWPSGVTGVRAANYMLQAQQKWTIAPAPNAGGYPGSPYFKITIAGTDRALTATEDGELIATPAFTGAPEQLWRVEQISDGTYRIMTKPSEKIKEPLALSAIGGSSVALTKYNPDSDKHRWLLKTP